MQLMPGLHREELPKLAEKVMRVSSRVVEPSPGCCPFGDDTKVLDVLS